MWNESVKKSLTFFLICVYDVTWSSTNDNRQYLVVCEWIFYLLIIETEMSEVSQTSFKAQHDVQFKLFMLRTEYTHQQFLKWGQKKSFTDVWLSQMNITFVDQRQQ